MMTIEYWVEIIEGGGGICADVAIAHLTFALLARIVMVLQIRFICCV